MSQSQARAIDLKAQELAARQQALLSPGSSTDRPVHVLPPSGIASGPRHPFLDYQIQQMLLGQQRQKQLLMENREPPQLAVNHSPTSSHAIASQSVNGATTTNGSRGPEANFELQQIAGQIHPGDTAAAVRGTQDPAIPPHKLQAYQMELMVFEQKNKMRLMQARAEPGECMVNHNKTSSQATTPTAVDTAAALNTSREQQLSSQVQQTTDSIHPSNEIREIQAVQGPPQVAGSLDFQRRAEHNVAPESARRQSITAHRPPEPATRPHATNDDTITPTPVGPAATAAAPGNTPQTQSLATQERAQQVQSQDVIQAAIEPPGATGCQVLYKIEGGEDTVYLMPPTVDNHILTGLSLKGNSRLDDEAEYLRQNPGLDFVVYRLYQNWYRRASLAQPFSPWATRETIRLVSQDMVHAVDAFLKAQPTFKQDFPQWKSTDPIHAPYLFWYRYRSAERLVHLPRLYLDKIRILGGWIDENYGRVYDDAEKQFEQGFVSYSTMPFFVKPGEPLVSFDGSGIRGVVAESWIKKDPTKADSEWSPSGDMDASWTVKVWSIGYDGNFYRQKSTLSIKLQHEGFPPRVDLTTLKVLPLRFASNEVRAKLERRGRIAWKTRHRNFVAYGDKTGDGVHDQSERYMVDFSTYRQLHADSPEFKRAYPYINNPDHTVLFPKILELDAPPPGPGLYVFPNTLVGYSLRQKKWQELDIDLIQEVSWNRKAFEHLVLDEETKELIHALVTSKLDTQQGTDLIHGKGNGLTILLAGAAGTGKTFTAESVAELAEKPLLHVTCGDLGTKPEEVENHLESILHLGKIWGCVVLLDEADAFLERRTLADLQRNALVSVFLRVLEYYDGILFLTSNRVEVIDEAFKSRIHLSLQYKPLTKPQRRKVWKNLLDRLRTLETENARVETIGERKRKLPDTATGIDFEDIEWYLTQLAEEEMNGRQIRNAITTARRFAGAKKVKMSYAHLRHVIKVASRFDK